MEYLSQIGLLHTDGDIVTQLYCDLVFLNDIHGNSEVLIHMEIAG
jgi:hypothetical protein